MNPTDKAEMQVEELKEGGAIAILPEGEENPQLEDDENDEVSSQNDDNSEVSYRNDEDREAIRAARREERKLKKQIHREKARESNHLIDALKKQNTALAERIARIEHKTSGAELARIDKAIEDANVQVEYAKMKMRDAVSNQDGDGVSRAEELLYDARRKSESLQTIKNQASRQPQQNSQVPDPMVQRLASDWMQENPWYDPNGGNEESQIAQIIDKKLTEEGFDAKSDEYWEELDYRMTKYLPKSSNSGYNPQQGNRVNRPRSVMTSSGRESTATTKANEFKISSDRVVAMKEAGLWDDPVVRQKTARNYAEWDRINKNRSR